MPKFKYRITTAKELLKGTSGVKDSIILQRLYLFFKERKTHANARGCNIISTGSSLLSYVNVSENSAKRSKMSTDTSKTALCSLMNMVLCAAPVEFWNCHIRTHQPVRECIKVNVTMLKKLWRTSRLKLWHTIFSIKFGKWYSSSSSCKTSQHTYLYTEHHMPRMPEHAM